LLLKSRTLHKKGARAVQFLIHSFDFFGIEVQNWMLIVVLLIIGFALLVWRTRDRV
jgi:hypothetical protein